ncbi:MAG: malonic semialdehyde reductase [Vulcanimicrobiaceae bacterium]
MARKQTRSLDAFALQTLFEDARSAQGFMPEPVSRDLLARIVALAECGPTSNNTLPMRVIFVTTPEGKARLRPALSDGNVTKTLAAPATAIVAADLAFYDRLPERFASSPTLRERYAGEGGAEAARPFAIQNATLQGAYLMLAARALGLDVGPMGGFDRELVDRTFFAGTTHVSLWLCNIGYADDGVARPRGPRLTVDEVATFQ